jgi:hypothetical protein
MPASTQILLKNSQSETQHPNHLTEMKIFAVVRIFIFQHCTIHVSKCLLLQLFPFDIQM